MLIPVAALPFIYHTSQKHQEETPFLIQSNFFSKTYPVGILDSSFFHESWGEYKATIYYPAKSSGISTPPDKTEAPYPALVFAHGFACTKEDYSWIGNYCASQGYVAILFTTPSQFDPFQAFPQSVDGIILSIDHLIVQNHKAEGPIKGMVDENRIGAMGHSMGAMTSLKAAAQDPRIKAVVSLAPGYFNTITEPYLDACKSIKVPTQIIMGSFDFICPPSGARIYYDTIPADKEMLIIAGADHGLGIWRAGDEPYWFNYIPVYDPIKQESYRNTTKKYFTSWFNFYLKNSSDYQRYIYGQEAWNDLKIGLLSELETKRSFHTLVINKQSYPIAGAEVTLLTQESQIIRRAFTNNSGEVIFPIAFTPTNHTFALSLRVVKEEWRSEGSLTSTSPTYITLTIRYSTDLDADGKINIEDLSIAALTFGSRTGEPKWNPKADIDFNGKVDIKDMARIAKDFGKTIDDLSP